MIGWEWLGSVLVAGICASGASAPPFAAGDVPVDPADPNIQYFGRWDFANPSVPWVTWQGASVVASFEGTGIRGTFDAGNSSEWYRVIIDDDSLSSVKLSFSSSPTTYTLASGLPHGVHKVEIVRETYLGSGVGSFHGFEVTGTGLVAPPPRPPHRLEFYGDSNLAGASLESEQNSSQSSRIGTHFGLAAITARRLDAEYHNISSSGETISGGHSRYDRRDWWNEDPQWDFTQYTPDVVVVNLGANDVGRPVPVIKHDYHAFLDDLRSTHPEAHIILFNGWGWDYDEPANYTHEVIVERADPNMAAVIFPWVFEQWHGCEYDHAGMAAYLAEHIAAVMAWELSPTDVVMNGYGMGGDVANGSFEDVAPFGGHGWRYYTDTGVDRNHDPAGAKHGDYYLRLADGAKSHQPNPARGGDAFAVTAWLRGARDGDQAHVIIDFRNQQIWTVPVGSTTHTVTLTTDWQGFRFQHTAPELGGSSTVYHTRLTFQAGLGDTVDVDDVRMEMLTAEPGIRGCFGIGCQCANDDPTAGCANSTGIGGRLSGSGSTSVGLDDLVLHATQLPPDNNGLFYMGDTQVQGPLFDGYQCALGVTFRFSSSIQNSGAGGTMTLGSGIVADSMGLIDPSETWHFHCWHRDVPGSPCGTGANLTNLYTVTFGP